MINSIIHGDSAETMNLLDADSIDLTVTSPPYDNLRTYNKGSNFDFHGIAGQLYRVTKPGGVVVWIVGDATISGSETGTSFRQALHFMSLGFNLHDTMIYKKNTLSHPSSNRYWQVFEYMFVFSKGKPKTFNPIMDRPNKWAGTPIHGTTRPAHGRLEKLNFKEPKIIAEMGARENIWEYNVGGGIGAENRIAYKHPAIFPLKLAEDNIKTWSNEGDLILDPMIGSGTTAIAAINTNRNYIGIDIDEEYVKLAKERIESLRVTV